MKKNFPISLINIFTLSLLLTSCSRIQPTTATATATLRPTLPAAATKAPTLTPTPTEIIVQGTVTIWHSWDEPQIPVLEEIITGFQTLYPNVLFDVLYVPVEDLQARFREAYRAGSGPTLLLGPEEWGPPLYDAGMIADLTGLASPELLSTLNPAAIGTAQYKNALIGLPYTIQGVVLYRNQSIIPEKQATFEDLAAQAKSVTMGDTIGADFERSFFFSGGHLLGIGGNLIGSDGLPAFNNEKGLAWIEMLRAFEKAGPTEFLSDNDLELFKAGKVGMIIDGSWNRTALADAIGAETLAIDPWPTYGEGHLSGFLQSENLYMSAMAAGDSQVATWKFMEYFLSTESQARLATATRIPAVTSIKVSDPLMTQAMVALAGDSPYPPAPEIEFYSAPMDAALQSIFEGKAQPAEALKTAEDAILAAMFGLTPTPQP